MGRTESDVTATKLVRDLPSVRTKLADGPVFVSSHGRREFVLLSNKDYVDLQALVTTDVDRLDAKLTLVLNTIETLVLVLDKDLKIRRANRAFCEYFDYDAADLRDQHLDTLVKNTSDQFLSFRIKEVLETGRSDTFEMPSSHRPGRQFEYRIRPWPGGVAFFAEDVTALVQARERQLRNTAIDQSILAMQGMATGVLDKQGNLARVTESLANMFGGERESMKGVPIFTMVDRSARPAIEKVLRSDSLETQTVDVQYLQKGTKLQPARLCFTRFQTAGDTDCFAFAMLDLGMIPTPSPSRADDN